MKTTIDIAEPLLTQAKKLAAERQTTLKAIVEESLRRTLAEENRPRQRAAVKTLVFTGRGLRPGLSWDDWAVIRALSYEGRGG